jgi:carbamoyl-phosphate synthase small subunit
MEKGYLILENGEIFEGEKIGADKETVCEVVFNTSMTGYLEIFTDPSYAGQGVVLTYPLIGNYGIITNDIESRRMWIKAVFIHEMAELSSNFRKEKELDEYLKENDIPGLKGINTRKLTKLLRDNGTMRGKIVSNIENLNEIINEIKQYTFPNIVGEVSNRHIQEFGEGRHKIALIDFGCKQNIIRSLISRDCTVTTFPQDVTAETILDGNFDGILLSNGPGNPEDCKIAIENIKKLYKSDIPIMGICLGHQLMAIACGFQTAKLKYGHRGPNHPVKELKTGKICITSQNHGYYVKEETINPEIAEVSYINVNDGTIEGLDYKNKNIFTVQFHPEACPGPQDCAYLFDRFIEML